MTNTTQKKPIYKRKWFIAIIIILVLCIIGIFMPGDDTGTKSATASKETEEKAESKNEEAKKNETKKETTEAPKIPQEHKNALNKAKTYSDVMFMSKQAIYDQLVSEHGEQFSEEAANYAMENLKADYKKNALEKAKTYQKEMSMSSAAIKEQLTSSYGEKFTEEEAQYAIDNLEQ